MDQGTHMLGSVQMTVRKAGWRMGIPEEELEQFLQPNRLLKVKVVFTDELGYVRSFIGFRSQHNNQLGPYKGGVRFHPGTTKEEVIALSILMTLKCAAVGLPYGGGKGGVAVDPRTLSKSDLEKLTRAYAHAIAPIIGDHVDIPAPDVNTDSQIISWMLDEYETIVKKKSPATFTGKPINKGGSEGRIEATGRGGMYALSHLLQVLPKKDKLTKIAVQGIGNVGSHFAQYAVDEGFTVVGLSDSRGAIYSEKGLDVRAVLAHKQQTGSIQKFASASDMSNDDLIALDTDVLVLAALENAIHANNVSKVRAKVIVEMANGPITNEALSILRRNGVIVIPDVIANAGGVIVSYFEWLQGLSGEKWDVEQVNNKLKTQITEAMQEVYEMSVHKDLGLKDAALMVAMSKLFPKTKNPPAHELM